MEKNIFCNTIPVPQIIFIAQKAASLCTQQCQSSLLVAKDTQSSEASQINIQMRFVTEHLQKVVMHFAITLMLPAMAEQCI